MNIHARSTNSFQVPGRALLRVQIEHLVGNGELALPQDNPIKDFLLDADKEFAQFKALQPEISILIIIWDDYIYEPITVLKHEQCGLLTPNSYLRDETGMAVQFRHVDAVVVVRHLAYFYRAAGDLPLVERAHALNLVTTIRSQMSS